MRKWLALVISLAGLFVTHVRANQLIVYSENGPGHQRGLFNFNTTTDTTTLRTSLQGTDNLYAMTQRVSDGAVFAVDGTSLLNVNVSTGATNAIGSLSGFTSLAIDPVSGTFYGLDSGELYTINPNTAAATLIGYPGTQVQGLAFSPADLLYTFNYPTGLLYTINTSTSAATRAPNPSFETNFANGECTGMTFSPTGNLYAGDFNSDVFSVSLQTGLGTQIGTTSVAQGQFGMVIVPEPTSVVPLIVVTLGFALRRKLKGDITQYHTKDAARR